MCVWKGVCINVKKYEEQTKKFQNPFNNSDRKAMFF